MRALTRSGHRRVIAASTAILTGMAVAGACSTAAGTGAGSTPGTVAGGSPAAGTSNASGTTPAAATPTAATATEVTIDDALYAPLEPVPAGPHGTLLRYQRIEPSLAPAATTFRILYRSESLKGQPIVVTGLVLVPTAPAPAGGRPVLTLAHGTTGVADDCAPSRRPKRSEVAAMDLPVERGWLVVGTDYEGLGTPGRHPYLVGESEGRSVLDAALAARALPGADAGPRVGIAGYSQGGHGSAWAHQIAPTWTPELEVVGTFAGAPATEIDLIMKAAAITPINGFAMMIVAGYAEAYPEADPDLVLTAKGKATLGAVDTGCTADVFKAAAGNPADYFKPEGLATAPWSTLAAANNAGQSATKDPVLIIHSDQDTTVPVGLSAVLHDRMCSVGQVVERRVLVGGGNHIQAAVPAYTEGLMWLADRFEGKPPKNDCPGR